MEFGDECAVRARGGGSANEGPWRALTTQSAAVGGFRAKLLTVFRVAARGGGAVSPKWLP